MLKLIEKHGSGGEVKHGEGLRGLRSTEPATQESHARSSEEEWLV